MFERHIPKAFLFLGLLGCSSSHEMGAPLDTEDDPNTCSEGQPCPSPDAGGPDATELGSQAMHACPGERPALTECFVGVDFADCGGTGEPRLGCKVDRWRSCRWFTGGCFAAGYLGSACPPEDLCCEDGWYFPKQPFEPNDPESDAVFRINLGIDSVNPLGPWDRSRALAVDVSYDSGLISPARDVVTCPESPGAWFCDGLGRVRVSREAELDTLAFYVTHPAGIIPLELKVEVITDDAGVNARVCRFVPQDSASGDFVCQFRSIDPATFDPQRDCATSGTLVLSSFPETLQDREALAGRLQATFDDGWEVSAEF